MSKVYSLALAAAVCVSAFAAAGTAEAKSGGGSKGGFSSSKSFSSSKVVFSKPDKHHKHHGHRYYGYGYAAPLVYASYSSCGWLKARALETGSPRWWARYEACRDGE